MPTIIEILDKLATEHWNTDWKNPAWKQYLLTGDKKHLKLLPKMSGWWGIQEDLLQAIGTPKSLDISGRRMLEALYAAKFENALGLWLGTALSEKEPIRDEFEPGRSVLTELGYAPKVVAALTAMYVRPLADKQKLTSAGKFLAGVSVADWLSVFDRLVKDRDSALDETGPVLAQFAPKLLTEILEERLAAHKRGGLDSSFWVAVLAKNYDGFKGLAARAYESDESWPGFEIGAKLGEKDFAKFGQSLEQRAIKILLAPMDSEPWDRCSEAKKAGVWLVTWAPQTSVEALQRYFATEINPKHMNPESQAEYKIEVLDAAVAKLRRAALPLLEACFQTHQPLVQFQALQDWMQFKDPADSARLAEWFQAIITADDPKVIAQMVRTSGDANPAFEPALWPLLGHKSRPVREITATVLARLGEARLSKAADLWAARKADTRVATVSWLKAIGTPAAVAELKARLELEEDDNVRDALLLALEKLAGPSAQTDPAEIERRLKQTLAKLDSPPVKWLDPKKLPAAKLKDGTKLSADKLLYLLYRQSRVKEMRADIEAKPLYALLDRASCRELAAVVLEAFFSSKMDAEDRWTMAFAALVGDDAIVPLLSHQIKAWADANRGKLAEYAVGALALLGTDPALLAVDAMSIRYRSKNKNIGKAAAEAFAEAARVRGLTVEELGDVVVPWLGFEPGKPRVVETGKAKVEVRIGKDFKLGFRDLATNKKLAKLPDSAPAAVKTEFKDLGANLKEAVKSQLLRMEALMVRQFRWPVAKWQELYLGHPLLLPFAQRLVWGLYDRAGKLARTFRALEDRTLTDAADESVALPAEGGVGIVHPLELAPEARQAWLKHLADYDIEPPFPQLERPVIVVKPEQQNTRFGKELEGTELNALTFKGRAERLGWNRGSVADAGSISDYLKTLPTAGADVFVGTDGMYIGMGMDDSITLGKVFFVKHGSVKTGGHEYDQPGEETDPRLIPFGQVPPIVFSEAMGDLQRIAGKGSQEA